MKYPGSSKSSGGHLAMTTQLANWGKMSFHRKSKQTATPQPGSSPARSPKSGIRNNFRMSGSGNPAVASSGNLLTKPPGAPVKVVNNNHAPSISTDFVGGGNPGTRPFPRFRPGLFFPVFLKSDVKKGAFLCGKPYFTLLKRHGGMFLCRTTTRTSFV